jgi:tetratricopeptide (TPR) repeat protein
MQEIERLARYKKIILIIFILFNGRLLSQVYPDKEIHNYLTSGIEQIIMHNYDSAENIFIELDEKYPKLPLGKIYITAVEISKSYDYGIPLNREKILLNLNDARNIADKLLQHDSENIWHIYFISLIEGYTAYFDAMQGSWFSALSDGLTAVSAFERCLKKDSLFYEAYVAIGTYKFWKSRKTEFFNWLPFVKDEKELGIELLEKAIAENSYNSYLAVSSLIWIYIELGMYEKAILVADSALKMYPDNRVSKWGKARALEEIDKEKSINLYFEILNSYPPEADNHLKEVILKHIIAQQYYKWGKNRESLEICKEILNINLSKEISEKLNGRLVKVKELKELLSRG